MNKYTSDGYPFTENKHNLSSGRINSRKQSDDFLEKINKKNSVTGKNIGEIPSDVFNIVNGINTEATKKIPENPSFISSRLTSPDVINTIINFPNISEQLDFKYKEISEKIKGLTSEKTSGRDNKIIIDRFKELKNNDKLTIEEKLLEYKKILTLIQGYLENDPEKKGELNKTKKFKKDFEFLE
ncbi:MAG: hypothetical protein Q9M94_01740 [Candidatus Gracilibacteria bacterium]|nr:hypothetical protein [Candidatus Gracilibacteria bacterium]MDQ7022954.1 hypothetical protein [Candidatus Gracilibacteria bacterium]